MSQCSYLGVFLIGGGSVLEPQYGPLEPQNSLLEHQNRLLEHQNCLLEHQNGLRNTITELNILDKKPAMSITEINSKIIMSRIGTITVFKEIACIETCLGGTADTSHSAFNDMLAELFLDRSQLSIAHSSSI